MVKVDFHVHSKCSKRPAQWILQKLGCPESFTQPLLIYRLAKNKTMTHVTISDHNTIEGALEIAHLPDTFISEEITTYFPENGCKIHVLALDITQSQHQDIQKARKNIHELAAYLRKEGIFHAVAHPMYAVNNRLTVENFEQLLLLFDHFELNGARSHVSNRHLTEILNSLTPEIMEDLASRHKFSPVGETPWKKGVLGGSDDHSGLNIARTYTRCDAADDLKSAFAAVSANKAKVESLAPTPLTMAHNLYGIAYQYYHSRFDLGRHRGKDVLMTFLDRSLNPRYKAENRWVSRLYFFWGNRRKNRSEVEGISNTLLGLLHQETRKLILETGGLMDLMNNPDPLCRELEEKWYEFVNSTANRILMQFADHLMNHLSGANVFNIFHTIGSAGGLYALLSPYFISFAQFTKDRDMDLDLRRRFCPPVLKEKTGQEPTVAHFTDTFYEVNGVALTLRQQAALGRQTGRNYTMITCHESGRAENGIVNFKPVGIHSLPEYPEIKLYYPPLLDMLRLCHEKQITHLHAATPGPIGLAALAISRILNLPISGTYHTALPQYAQYLTQDRAITELTWKYTLWYYDQMDFVYVSSQASGSELIEKGLAPEKIRIIPRGIDTNRFSPEKRNGYLKKGFNIHAKTVFLYVGRVSKEKNLPVLEKAYAKVADADTHLVVVGDGPYLSEMKARMKDLPVTFTGYLTGDDLPQVYASSHVFVFPSTTDTFGNVVLEAQASGLPVIVTDQGGPCENMAPGTTGLLVKGKDEADLARAMGTLKSNPRLVRRMGRAAHDHMKTRSFQAAFLKTFEMYGQSRADAGARADFDEKVEFKAAG